MSLRVGFIVESGTDVRLVDGLAERGPLTIVARQIPGGRVISQPPAGLPALEVGPAGHAAFAWFVARRWQWLRARTDVVIVQGYGPAAAMANLLGRVTGHPVRMLVCSPVEAYYRARRASDSTRPYRGVEYGVIAALARLNGFIGQRYIALSPYLAGVIRESGTRRPVDVIPIYGVDDRIFQPAAEPAASIRVRLGLDAASRIVFFSSRVAPEKDAATVLRAIALLVGAGRPVRLLHLSGGFREFLALAESLAVAERVVAGEAVAPFAGLADYYRASDVCVQASREEGLGFSPLEALACGVPVVASAVGGLTNTIRNGDTGWSVPAGDATAMADAIAAVLDNPAEAARRTARGRDMVLAGYRRDDVFDALARSLNGAGHE